MTVPQRTLRPMAGREQDHVSPEEILARAQAAAPLLRERSEEIERGRRLPQDVVELLRATGVFRVGMPKEWGGPELTFAQQCEVIEALSYGDASAGWCAMIGMDTWIYAGYLDQAVVDEMLADPDAITAGLIFPVGRADRVPGGYRVTGRWPFGSGVTHADWVVGGCAVYRDGAREPGPGGAPTNWRLMLARAGEFQQVDTWHTTGLAGSGSMDYQVTDLFVPEERSFDFMSSRRSGPLAAPDAFLSDAPGVPLGVARAALDHVRALASGRADRATGTPWPDSYRVQTVIGQAEMEITAARYAVYGTLNDLWQRLEADIEPTPDQQVSTALARVNAFRTARSVVSRLADLVGTASIYRTSPLDRWLRDAHTMCQHILAQEQIVQSAGAHLLGGTPQAPFPLGLRT
ncbi:hydroxylase [Sphaerisporangium siamense]|uniref:Alkylation response protein AidB-like acyl-CoA dehydrogenase n=1 Tax=Sphaerisporangium siamense TaxID=795645 RepID=A0A7W7DFI1_9ACTN|nr:acyl-CoA dehydrogenase family protein [Sphaerisporangium siamense]MBB4704781.1 alkylation response protein AidB-like acyl-CoA dehydrogenase [Sphaerisporangium siamense]GII88720.1 hydroxylase [Sphaerisporangium siamense]